VRLPHTNACTLAARWLWNRRANNTVTTRFLSNNPCYQRWPPAASTRRAQYKVCRRNSFADTTDTFADAALNNARFTFCPYTATVHFSPVNVPPPDLTRDALYFHHQRRQAPSYRTLRGCCRGGVTPACLALFSHAPCQNAFCATLYGHRCAAHNWIDFLLRISLRLWTIRANLNNFARRAYGARLPFALLPLRNGRGTAQHLPTHFDYLARLTGFNG